MKLVRMVRLPRLVLHTLCVFLFCLALPLAGAQDSARQNPKNYKVGEVTGDILGSISPDGRFLSYMDMMEGKGSDEVFVLDFKTGERRRLTNAGPEGEAGTSRISRDGRQVAYGWANYKDGFQELRTIGLDGSGDRVLYRAQDVQRIYPQDWSADGKHILATFWSKGGTWRMALVSLADGSMRVLKTGGQEEGGRFSPDGRYIAYQSRPQAGSPHGQIFLLPVEGGRDVSLQERPNDQLLDWTPNGKGILFTSDRGGTVDVWLMQVADGRPRGSPLLVKADVGPVTGLGFGRNGSYYYGRTAWVNDVYLTSLDPSTGKLQGPEKLVNHVRFHTSVEWSPDGQSLAYIRPGRYPVVLGIRSAKTGQERRLRLKMTGVHGFQPRWSPDGRSLRVQGRDLRFRQGLYRIDAQTGEVTPILQAEPSCILCIDWPAWPSERSVIFNRLDTSPRSIVARDLQTGQEKELYRGASRFQVVSNLALSPDGQQLAFVWWDVEGQRMAVKIMPPSGGEPRTVLELPVPGQPGWSKRLLPLAWTPDSRHIIYAPSAYAPSAAGKRTLELWRIAAAGGEPQNLGLALEGLLPFGLSVHPDGRRIAFTAGTKPHQEVWVMENFLPAVGANQ